TQAFGAHLMMIGETKPIAIVIRTFQSLTAINAAMTGAARMTYFNKTCRNPCIYRPPLMNRRIASSNGAHQGRVSRTGAGGSGAGPIGTGVTTGGTTTGGVTTGGVTTGGVTTGGGATTGGVGGTTTTGGCRPVMSLANTI